jgi:hypothetical protein
MECQLRMYAVTEEKLGILMGVCTLGDPLSCRRFSKEGKTGDPKVTFCSLPGARSIALRDKEKQI